jgi:hypothetical protein
MKKKFTQDKHSELKEGVELFYSDTQAYFGTIVKVLKRDVHVKLQSGKILKGWQKSIAIKMLKSE